MRTVSGPETTVLTGRVSAQYLKIEVKDAVGAWVDYSAFLSIDWQDRCAIDMNVNDRVAEATVELARETEVGGLSPLMNTEIATGRAIRIGGSRVAVGGGASFKPLFLGKIDRVDWKSDPMQLIARDDSGMLVDRWVQEEGLYGSDVGTAIETVMQALIDNWAAGAFTLYTPASPGFLITTYLQQKQSVMEALQALAGTIGWVIEYRWDSGTSAFRLTFYEPDRTPASTAWTFGPNEYYEVTRLDEDSANVRNTVTVRYTDAATGARLSETVSDATSIAKYGLLWAEFEEADDSPIDTAAEALAMASAALADLSSPVADQEIEVDLFWPVQLGDPYEFEANGKHYGANQEFGVTGYTHVFENGRATTRIRTRGTPVGYVSGWLKRETIPRPEDEIAVSLQLIDFQVIGRTATTQTWGWTLGTDLADAAAFYVTAVEPFDEVNWPDPLGTPDAVIITRAGEHTVTLPATGSIGYLVVAGRRADASLGEIERDIAFRTIVYAPGDIATGAVISEKLREGAQNMIMDLVFSPTDRDTVAWTAGTVRLAGGSSYSIAAGNTGNMTTDAPRYIYIDPAVSSTVLQLSLATVDALGDTKILIAVAWRGPAGQEAAFVPVVGLLGINETFIGEDSISTGKIQALAINAGLIAAGAVTAAKINVASLSAISADIGTVTAGTIQTNVLIASDTFAADSAVFEGAIIVGNGGTFSGVGIINGGTFDVLDNSGDGVIGVRGGLRKIAFFDKANAPIVQPTVTGSRGGNAALASLLTKLDDLGLLVDSSS